MEYMHNGIKIWINLDGKFAAIAVYASVIDYATHCGWEG